MTFYVRVFLAIIFKLVLEILNDRIFDNDFVYGVIWILKIKIYQIPQSKRSFIKMYFVDWC